MTTIAMNTVTGAVTEYDWEFQSLTASHAGGDGLYALGGDDDAGAPIDAYLHAGKPGGRAVQHVDEVFVAGSAVDNGVLVVSGRHTSWQYPVIARGSGVGIATPGRGIRESYLGFGYRNVGGADFRIDRIDAEVIESRNRRN